MANQQNMNQQIPNFAPLDNHTFDDEREIDDQNNQNVNKNETCNKKDNIQPFQNDENDCCPIDVDNNDYWNT